MERMEVRAPSLAFDDALRRRVATHLAGFSRSDPLPHNGVLKRAAVAVTLVAAEDDGDGAAFLLALRPARMRRHSNQYALPGGRCDEGESAVEAALRELHEEVGLERGPEHVLGILDDYPTRSGYLITPVVVWGGEEPAFTPNPDEVAVLYRVPLAAIAAPETPEFFAIPESDNPVIRFHIVGTRVHPPTAAILYQFREIALFGRPTRVAHLDQPVFAWK